MGQELGCVCGAGVPFQCNMAGEPGIDEPDLTEAWLRNKTRPSFLAHSLGFKFVKWLNDICLSGKSPKSCPSPFAKLFRFRRQANQDYRSRRPVPKRGVGHV